LSEVDQTLIKTDALQHAQQAAIAAGHHRHHHEDQEEDDLVQDVQGRDVDDHQGTDVRDVLDQIEVGEDQGV